MVVETHVYVHTLICHPLNDCGNHEGLTQGFDSCMIMFKQDLREGVRAHVVFYVTMVTFRMTLFMNK